MENEPINAVVEHMVGSRPYITPLWLKALWPIRRIIWRFSDKNENCLCDLCLRTVHHTATSNYYHDVTACLICCPPGYVDPDAED